jgi:hypothetical protein
LVVPSSPLSFEQLSRAGVNELELCPGVGPDGATGLRVRDSALLVLSSSSWVSAQIAAQVAMAERIRVLEAQLVQEGGDQ